MTTANPIERRRNERFALAPMYTDVTVQTVSDLQFRTLEGHAYDISQCGVRIELDEPLEIGDRVGVHLGLPGEDVEVHAAADVVWRYESDDDPGPRRMALHFHDFLSTADRDRLIRFLGSGVQRVA